MNDDLDSFFAKKKAKLANKRKKVGVQDVQVLAQQLERTVREQEELDRLADEQREQILKEETAVKAQTTGVQKQINAHEDSEWIEYNEEADVDVNKLNIKDYEQEEIELLQSDTEEVVVQPRGWNIESSDGHKTGDGNINICDDKTKKDDAVSEKNKAEKDVVPNEDGTTPVDDKMENNKTEGDGETSVVGGTADSSSVGEAAPEPPKPQAYVPPSKRGTGTASESPRRAIAGLGGRVIAPNLSDAMQFPSLGDADTIEAQEIEKQKKEEIEKQKKVVQHVPNPMPPPPRPARNESPTEAWSRKIETTSAAPSEAPWRRGVVPGGGNIVVENGGTPAAASYSASTASADSTTASPPSKPKSSYVPPHMRKTRGELGESTATETSNRFMELNDAVGN